MPFDLRILVSVLGGRILHRIAIICQSFLLCTDGLKVWAGCKNAGYASGCKVTIAEVDMFESGIVRLDAARMYSPAGKAVSSE